MLGASATTVRRHIEAGDLPAIWGGFWSRPKGDREGSAVVLPRLGRRLWRASDGATGGRAPARGRRALALGQIGVVGAGEEVADAEHVTANCVCPHSASSCQGRSLFRLIVRSVPAQRSCR